LELERLRTLVDDLEWKLRDSETKEEMNKKEIHEMKQQIELSTKKGRRSGSCFIVPFDLSRC